MLCRVGGRLKLSAINLDKPKGAPYYMGCRKVITNLWKSRIVYARVTAADPKNPDCYRPFLGTAEPEGIAVEPEKQADEKIRSYHMGHAATGSVLTMVGHNADIGIISKERTEGGLNKRASSCALLFSTLLVFPN